MTQPDIYMVEARRRLADVEGCEGLAENIRKGHAVAHYVRTFAATLRELNWQPPVDPDLLEARKVAAAHWQHSDPRYASEILSGICDSGVSVSVAIPAIKRGRELAAQDRGA